MRDCCTHSYSCSCMQQTIAVSTCIDNEKYSWFFILFVHPQRSHIQFVDDACMRLIRQQYTNKRVKYIECTTLYVILLLDSFLEAVRTQTKKLRRNPKHPLFTNVSMCSLLFLLCNAFMRMVSNMVACNSTTTITTQITFPFAVHTMIIVNSSFHVKIIAFILRMTCDSMFSWNNSNNHQKQHVTPG